MAGTFADRKESPPPDRPRVAQLVLLAHVLAADNDSALCACHRISGPDTDAT